MERRYSELVKFDNYADRLRYLQLLDFNAHESPRWLSMLLYKSKVWRNVRKEVLERDLGFDLGVLDCSIDGNIYVHHINPITAEDIIEGNADKLYNLENLITVSHKTHNLIHYGTEVEEYVERQAGDTKLW